VSVRRNTQGCYIVDILWPDKIRTRSKMPDKATAERINKKIEVAVVDEDRIWQKLRKDLRLEHNQILSFVDLADRYFDDYVKVYNRDIRVKNSRLKVLKAYYGQNPMDCLNLQSVSKFFAGKRGEGVTNATINRYRALLRHMTSWAIGQGILELDPLAKLVKLKEVEWVGTRPDDALIDFIFGKMDSRVLPIFVFLRETGCRRAEAISVTLSQIDFARQVVTFHTNTKSGRSRQVPLTEKGLWAVQALPAFGPTVFYHPEHMKPWTGDGLAIFWEKARTAFDEEKLREKCGTLRIHDLRHAFAIKLAEEGVAMHHISEVMGHHSTEFTRIRYARFSPESSNRAVLRVLQGRKAESKEVMAQNWHS
jgi:integrase